VRECDVISSYGGHSGYNAVSYVSNLPKGKRVELAILDITLGMAVRFDADNFIMLNGIDVAKKIKEKFPDVLIIFLTSHSMNESNPTIKEYMNQCQRDLGVDIMSLYVHKNSNEAAEDIERVIDYQKKVRAEKN
jgi:CheY-like chemotaxis protein